MNLLYTLKRILSSCKECGYSLSDNLIANINFTFLDNEKKTCRKTLGYNCPACGFQQEADVSELQNIVILTSSQKALPLIW